MSDEQEFIGFGPAATYLGMKGATLRAYVLRNQGPAIERRELDRQYLRPVFTLAELKRWKASRPGQGKGGGRKVKQD